MRAINIILLLTCLGLSYFVSLWFIIGIVYFTINHVRIVYLRQLKQIRDNADFTTEYGKALIQGCNKRINILNGQFPKQTFENTDDYIEFLKSKYSDR